MAPVTAQVIMIFWVLTIILVSSYDRMPWYSEVQELVGSIAIGEGLIRSVDDPIVNYLPELKGRGFDPITIRNLLIMQSGIRYRISQFP